MRGGLKIEDSNPVLTEGSRADIYWHQNGYKPLYHKVRPKLDLPENLKTNDLTVIIQKFNLKGIGYGNWLTIEDRINYTNSLTLACYDLNKVLRFNYNIGFGLLSVTFGARGRSKALAHYEPGRDIINITRYHDGKAPKEARFFGSGGLNSLAHEYGHFLDYFAGGHLAPNPQIFSLTNGHSIARGRTDTGNKMRNLTDDLMEEIIWRNPDKQQLSDYYKRLIDTVGTTSMGEYWLRRNEIFARAFEVYVMNKFSKMGITNLLLTGKKYNPQVYLKNSEMQKLEPKFDALLEEIRKSIK